MIFQAITALAAVIMLIIKIREHLIDYPLTKHKEDNQDEE